MLLQPTQRQLSTNLATKTLEVGKEEAIPSALDAGCAGLTLQFAINHFVIRQAIEVRL